MVPQDLEEVYVLKIRIKYSKLGNLRFIGHLDVMRYFQKEIRRAGLDVSYSKGYSPHQIISFAFIDLIHTLQLDITGADISFAAPLAMGITSDGEYFDGEFESVTTSREMIDALNAVSVDEMKVTECVLLPDDAKNSMSVVSASDYVISFLDKAVTEERHNILDSVESFMSQDQIVILKKTKKSEREENIKPGIMTCELRDDQIYMLLSTGSEYNLKPELVMQALCAYAGVSHNQFHYHIHRLETYMDGPDGNIIPLYKAGSPF